MKPREPRESGQHDMFRSRLDQILDMGHEKVILSDKIDWQFCRTGWRRLYGRPRPSAAVEPPDGGAAYPQIRGRPVR